MYTWLWSSHWDRGAVRTESPACLLRLLQGVPRVCPLWFFCFYTNRP